MSKTDSFSLKHSSYYQILLKIKDNVVDGQIKSLYKYITDQ